MSTKAKISNVQEQNGTLSFTLSNINVSYANGLRRVILSEIPVIAIESYPYEKNNVNILANKSRLNNELIKQRLSCIPIHIDALQDFPYDEYVLEVNKGNDSNVIKNDGMFNVVSTCSYGNTLDQVKIKDAWESKEAELKLKYGKEEIETMKKDWMILDAKRIYEPDSFDYIIETIGIYDNFKLVEIATNLLIKKLFNSLKLLKENMDFIQEMEDTMENSYSIRLENEDYTIGKIIEFNFYDKYFINSKNLNYVSFLKKHPHDNFSIIKLSYKNQITKDDILLNFEECINSSILLINSIKEYFSSK
jgi:DNA-directed RNA polymerase subunit L